MKVLGKCSQNRYLAWLLVFAMVAGLCAVPGGNRVRAAVSGFSLTRLAGANQNSDYSEVYYRVQNDTDAAVNGILILQKTNTKPTNPIQAYESTVTAKYDEAKGGVLIYYNKSISAHGSLELTNDYKVGFNVPPSELGDYEVLEVNGDAPEGGIVGSSGGGTSSGGSGSGGGTDSGSVDTSTDTNLEVEYNYAKLLQESLYFYDANMCGDEVDEKSKLTWRGDCHTGDKNQSVTINGKSYTVDVSGGFHDAGDHVKFGLPQGYAASVLGMSYYEFQDAFKSTGSNEHIKTILNHFCDYFTRCTIYDGNAVVGFVYQVGNGDVDHAVWDKPENQNEARQIYCADANTTATDEICVAVAALAINYLNFGREADLKTAKDLFAFAQNSSKGVATVGLYASNGQPFYESTSYRDDYGLAAAALYVATKNDAYKTEYQNKGTVNTGWVMDWDNTGAIAAMLMNESDKVKGVADALQNKKGGTLHGVFDWLHQWGSCRYNAAAQFVGLAYDKMTSTTTYKAHAISQINYMIGDNPAKRCYAVGYNANSSKYPHHRAASNSGDAGSVNTEGHYTLLGALVGGPMTNGVYQDNQNDYTCNEVALDYNAGYVGALAGLYLACKDDTQVYLSYAKKNVSLGKTLLTKEELNDLSVKAEDQEESGENPSGNTSEPPETNIPGDTDQSSETNEPTDQTSGTNEPGTDGSSQPSGTNAPGVDGSSQPSGTNASGVDGSSQPSGTNAPGVNGSSQPSGTNAPGVNGSSQPSGTNAPGVNGSGQPSGTNEQGVNGSSQPSGTNVPGGAGTNSGSTDSGEGGQGLSTGAPGGNGNPSYTMAPGGTGNQPPVTTAGADQTSPTTTSGGADGDPTSPYNPGDGRVSDGTGSSSGDGTTPGGTGFVPTSPFNPGDGSVSDGTGSSSGDGTTPGGTGNGSGDGSQSDGTGSISISDGTGSSSGDGTTPGGTGNGSGNGSISDGTGSGSGDGTTPGGTGNGSGDGSVSDGTGSSSGGGTTPGGTGNGSGDGSLSDGTGSGSGDGTTSGGTGNQSGNGTVSGGTGNNAPFTISSGAPGNDSFATRGADGIQLSSSVPPQTVSTSSPVPSSQTSSAAPVGNGIKAAVIKLSGKVAGAAKTAINGSWQLAPQKTLQLQVTLLPVGADSTGITYTSSNPEIASVAQDGLVTAGIQEGEAMITVTTPNGISHSFTVRVMKEAVKKIKITGKKKIKVKKTIHLKAKINPSASEASHKVFWKSSKPKVLKVSASGKVKALKKGKAKIIAIAADGSGKKASITIKSK